MSFEPPKIDSRSLNEIVRQTRSLASQYLNLTPKDFDKFISDQTSEALIQIFARLVQIIIQRLNKVPDKNFLAFLDLVGVSLLPPKAARAPLNFTLAEGTTNYGFVPAGTQVATAQTEEQPGVVFETANDITVITPQLVKAFSLDPTGDQYADHSRALQIDNVETFQVFAGDRFISHLLLLGDDQIFGFKEPSDITLDFEINPGSIPSDAPWNVNWYKFNEEQQLIPISFENDLTNSLKQSGKIKFAQASEMLGKSIAGIEKKSSLPKTWLNNWLIAKLTTPIPQNSLPQITGIKASVNIPSTQPVNPDKAFTNNILIDLSKDFYPFGEKPKFNDAFYIGSKKVLSKPNASVTITVALSDAIDLPDTVDLKLVWEFWNNEIWEKLGTIQIKWEDNSKKVTVTPERPEYNFSDSTEGFTLKDGTISFKCPVNIAIRKFQDEENYWFRIRIVDGDYGKEATYEKGSITGSSGSTITVYTYKPPSFKPPSISSLKLSYTYTLSESNLQQCLTYNNFEYIEHFLNPDGNYEAFNPFEPVTETQSMLYLGFDRNISALPVTLYFSILEKIVTASKPISGIETLPTLIWEYWDGAEWTKLDVEDETRALTERGMAQLLVPSNIASRYLFEVLDQKYYWIRVSIGTGKYNPLPQLRGIYPNTVWAYHRVTVPDEVLGSSDEKANQTFVFTQSPVFPGQKIVIKESETPTGDELNTILTNEGEDAIQEIFDDNGNLIEVWVRWHEVENFYSSGPHSRDYILDHVAGKVSFGDGIHGMIPPRGAGNIKCELYQYGGGTKGNVAAKTINELRTSIPYIDSVINIDAAEGGADAEALDKVKERGPQTLKHRDRAVTWEDYEWLVLQASTAIARVKCIPAYDGTTAGLVTIIIIPQSTERTPSPSSVLLRQVNEYLQQRSPAQICTLESVNIRLSGPEYIEISVIDIKFKAIDLNQTLLVEKRIRDNLKHFLHPLIGGPEGRGWDFGRIVFPSEIYSVIEATEGVDYVSSIKLKALNLSAINNPEVLPNDDNSIPIEKYQLICSGLHKFNYK